MLRSGDLLDDYLWTALLLPSKSSIYIDFILLWPYSSTLSPSSLFNYIIYTLYISTYFMIIMYLFILPGSHRHIYWRCHSSHILPLRWPICRGPAYLCGHDGGHCHESRHSCGSVHCRRDRRCARWLETSLSSCGGSCHVPWHSYHDHHYRGTLHFSI